MIDCPYKPGQILKLRGELLGLDDPAVVRRCRITCVHPGRQYIVVQHEQPGLQPWADTFTRLYFSEIPA